MDPTPDAPSPRPRPRPVPSPPSFPAPQPPPPPVSISSVARPAPAAPLRSVPTVLRPDGPAAVEPPRPPRLTVGLLGSGALLPAAMFCLAACALLILGSGHTSEVFAWTAGSAASAASLGAGFAAAAVFFEVSGLAETWVDARLGVVTLLTGAPLLLLAAALRPHELAGADSSATRSAPTATAVAAVWWVALAILIVVTGLGLRVQLRAAGSVSSERMPLATRLPGAVLGAAVTVIAAYAYVAPGHGRHLLPFPTTPMDVRALAAVHVSIGVTLLVASVVSAPRQQAGALAGLAAYLAVQGAVLALRRHDVAWHGAAVLGFLAYLAVLLGALVLGLWQYARASQPPVVVGDRS